MNLPPNSGYTNYSQPMMPINPNNQGTPTSPPVTQEIQKVLKDNRMTWLMGIGCLLMNFIPGLKMSWKMAGRMALANMGLMVLIDKGLGLWSKSHDEPPHQM